MNKPPQGAAEGGGFRGEPRQCEGAFEPTLGASQQLHAARFPRTNRRRQNKGQSQKKERELLVPPLEGAEKQLPLPHVAHVDRDNGFFLDTVIAENTNAADSPIVTRCRNGRRAASSTPSTSGSAERATVTALPGQTAKKKSTGCRRGLADKFLRSVSRRSAVLTELRIFNGAG